MDIVIQQPHLLSLLEGRQPNVWTPITAESVAEGAIPAGTDLALDGEVNLGEVVGGEAERVDLGIAGGAGGLVLGLEALSEAAGAVLAGAAALAYFWDAFWGYIR